MRMVLTVEWKGEMRERITTRPFDTNEVHASEVSPGWVSHSTRAGNRFWKNTKIYLGMICSVGIGYRVSIVKLESSTSFFFFLFPFLLLYSRPPPPHLKPPPPNPPPPLTPPFVWLAKFMSVALWLSRNCKLQSIACVAESRLSGSDLENFGNCVLIKGSVYNDSRIWLRKTL